MDDFAKVLARYPQPIRALNWTRLGDAGGFSGAALWRGDYKSKPIFCAKRYPTLVELSDISRRQSWMQFATRRGLAFVPNLLTNIDGETLSGSWEIQTWMPGAADFHIRPSRDKLVAACHTVSELHTVWKSIGVRVAPSRAVRDRLAIFVRWKSEPKRPSAFSPSTEARARAAIAEHLDRAESQLLPWADRALPCQPCVRDLRRDHFLFDGDRLTGLIDYGAADWDTPATDAARMLGELASGDCELYETGIGAFPGCDPDLIRALDRAGVVGSIIHWLVRGIPPATSAAKVEARLSDLIRRLENRSF